MDKYYFGLKLDNQGKPGERHNVAITAENEVEALSLFRLHITNETEYEFIEEDVIDFTSLEIDLQ